ncbi:MAG: TIGR02710 family CRISPR-associated CARF protein, partial [Nanoarchaeota archaeon]
MAPGLDEFMARFAIEKIKPDYIAFLATEATINYIPAMVKGLNVKEYRTFFIKDIFSTTETIQEFFNAINWIKEIGTVKNIYIEATNCITVIEMSTYITASILDIFREVLGEDIKVHLLYIHASYKIKEDGVFGEVRGTEKLVELEQPIDSLSFVLALEGIVAFNLQRYEQATKIFTPLTNNTTGDKSILYRGLTLLSIGYEQWDKMNFADALKSLEEVKINLEKVKYFESVLGVIAKVDDNINTIKKLINNSKMSIILDLYSNALRRMNENRFDDALARLYACVERITQFQLEKYGIDTKIPDYSKITSEVIDKFKKQIGFLPTELELKKNALLLLL